MKYIATNLKIPNPIDIPSKTGHGIHELKEMIGNHHTLSNLAN